VDERDIYQAGEVAAWLRELQEGDPQTAGPVDDAIYALSRSGPALGPPLVDTIVGSRLANLKELRPGSRGRTDTRVLFASGRDARRSCSSPARRPEPGRSGTR
jgi:hypothetical protein